MTQVIGVLLLALAGWLLWSPWALVIAGVLLVIGPEFAEFQRRNREASTRIEQRRGTP